MWVVIFWKCFWFELLFENYLRVIIKPKTVIWHFTGINVNSHIWVLKKIVQVQNLHTCLMPVPAQIVSTSVAGFSGPYGNWCLLRATLTELSSLNRAVQWSCSAILRLGCHVYGILHPIRRDYLGKKDVNHGRSILCDKIFRDLETGQGSGDV